MKKYFYAPVLAIAASAFFAACEDEVLLPMPPPPPPPVTGTSTTTTTTRTATDGSTMTQSETATTSTSTSPTTATPPPPVPEPTGPLQVGQPVPGKPGFVTSPHSTDPNAVIDVTGLPTGTEVRDPYTNKTFMVP